MTWHVQEKKSIFTAFWSVTRGLKYCEFKHAYITNYYIQEQIIKRIRCEPFFQ